MELKPNQINSSSNFTQFSINEFLMMNSKLNNELLIKDSNPNSNCVRKTERVQYLLLIHKQPSVALTILTT